MVEMINTALMRTVMAAGRLRRRLTEERGQDLMEYALLGGLIAAALVAVATLEIMNGAVTNMVTGIANCIDFTNGIDCGTAPAAGG